MRATVTATAVLLLAAGAAACGSGGDGDEPGNAIRITESEYAFTLEGDLKPGAVTVDVANNGEQLHEVAFVKLRAGRTMADVRAALEEARPDRDPLEGLTDEDAVLDDIGGAQFPGTRLRITGTDVEPGEYAVVCFIPDEQGRPHAALGMVGGFTVEGEPETEVPEADVTYTATGDRTEGPRALEAGETTIAVRNASGTAREIVLLKVRRGKTLDDVEAFFDKLDEEGPGDLSGSPLDFMTFVFDSDKDRYLTVDLTPGQWAIGVQDPDHEDDPPPREDPEVVLFQVS